MLRSSFITACILACTATSADARVVIRDLYCGDPAMADRAKEAVQAGGGVSELFVNPNGMIVIRTPTTDVAIQPGAGCMVSYGDHVPEKKQSSAPASTTPFGPLMQRPEPMKLIRPQ